MKHFAHGFTDPSVVSVVDVRFPAPRPGAEGSLDQGEGGSIDPHVPEPLIRSLSLNSMRTLGDTVDRRPHRHGMDHPDSVSVINDADFDYGAIAPGTDHDHQLRDSLVRNEPERMPQRVPVVCLGCAWI